MPALTQYVQMIIQSVSHGVGPYLATTFMLVVLMPFLLDIFLSIVGVKSHLGEKALKFWAHWFIKFPVQMIWKAVTTVFTSFIGQFKKKKPRNP